MALTPEDVVNKRFQPTKFREGYDQDEVDDFLDEVVGELRRLTTENEQLQQKLVACERRVTELGRAGAAAAVPAQERPPVVERQAPPVVAAVPASAAAPASGPEAATGMLALAQKLHDDFVRSGEEQRDKIVGEAKDHATRLVREAEEKQRQTLGSLEQERSLLERKIDELRAFERDYRNRMKSYLESQLRDLESRGAALPGRPAQPAAQEAAYPFGGGAG
ncbi:DivIVA domain-containing protein [Quadrisphaera sp. DSM 44207]|uniref:DivIVA domain-containing protein n=1 Tax=Quadrisphaera sp. DSM 44207 TaxID=1881057 RepID=UPI000882A306|nr:DivIVA domain-containing protein [Quadrisphaera sp. DSM 44207]SDQ53325.1 DivIVA domain-containing protein [Quadrisphaera sp. DSM 44207]